MVRNVLLIEAGDGCMGGRSAAQVVAGFVAILACL